MGTDLGFKCVAFAFWVVICFQMLLQLVRQNARHFFNFGVELCLTKNLLNQSLRLSLCVSSMVVLFVLLLDLNAFGMVKLRFVLLVLVFIRFVLLRWIRLFPLVVFALLVLSPCPINLLIVLFVLCEVFMSVEFWADEIKRIAGLLDRAEAAHDSYAYDKLLPLYRKAQEMHRQAVLSECPFTGWGL